MKSALSAGPRWNPSRASTSGIPSEKRIDQPRPATHGGAFCCAPALSADSSGREKKEEVYDPFGGIIEETNPDLRIPLGFAGGLHDKDLGFVRFGWRDYDAFTGRWTAPDPMGDAGGEPDWYGYCLDDPVNLNDPEGLIWKWAVKKAVKSGLKKGGSKAAEKEPESSFWQGVDRFLNGKDLDKDPKASDSDNDGIPDYYDYDSDWDVNTDQLIKDREDYHKNK